MTTTIGHRLDTYNATSRVRLGVYTATTGTRRPRASALGLRIRDAFLAATIGHQHVADPTDPSRHPNCICGEWFWTGTRWTPIPDEGAYA